MTTTSSVLSVFAAFPQDMTLLSHWPSPDYESRFRHAWAKNEINNNNKLSKRYDLIPHYNNNYNNNNNNNNNYHHHILKKSLNIEKPFYNNEDFFSQNGLMG